MLSRSGIMLWAAIALFFMSERVTDGPYPWLSFFYSGVATLLIFRVGLKIDRKGEN